MLYRFRSDEALMQAYQAGNTKAFAELYQRHKNGLFGFLSRMAGAGRPAATVEDLAQDTWMSIIKQTAGYEPRAKFRTYLYTLARRKFIDYLRRTTHWIETGDEAMDAQPYMASDSHSPAAALEVQRLLQAIAALPQEQREAFLLKEEGFTLNQIATITQVETETAKSRLRYARQRLRQTLHADYAPTTGDNP
ncbi:sigma-70 family RNA polymerase sigma factor [Exilibacterium tricleocarpae]|uniref:Sigma-70 family RNA polymerase sigma factor n=1 Tax=Exilibacterium tricleocarpae TaxID=2591008 RepID=A0A545TLJ2_9GAMM|nr:sigma-70 family RNA polymerase sigma factor [Exilibacterium tricleocarpae]TQV78087.1 sigma-70 family RNA polymerase sigma factor [Exilibacterium tricleocarpae]